MLGTAIAVALKQRFRFRGIVLALVILPWALPAVVEAVIWNWIYNPTFGVMNSALHSAHVIGGYHVWLGLDRWLTIVLIEIVQVWQITPLSALIILAALQSIPPDLYEAARVDGASAVQSFRRISLPLIRPALAVCAVEALVLSLNIFDQVYILNGIAPLGSSVMLQTYVTTFENLNFGGGYALSLLVTLATARAVDGRAGAALPQDGGGVMAADATGERTARAVTRTAAGPSRPGAVPRRPGCSAASSRSP